MTRAVDFIIPLVLFGATVGGLEWLGRRDHVPNAGWWVAASAAGCVLGGGSFPAVGGWVAASVAAWTTYGTMTGVVLARLLIRSWDSWW